MQPSIFAPPHDKFVLRGSSGAVRQPDIIFSSKPDHVWSNPLSEVTVRWCWNSRSSKGLTVSKSRDGSDSARSAMRSTVPSATSNNSTGLKRPRDLLASDSMSNKSPRKDGDAKSVELQLALYALESFTHGPYRIHVVHGTVLGIDTLPLVLRPCRCCQVPKHRLHEETAHARSIPDEYRVPYR